MKFYARVTAVSESFGEAMFPEGNGRKRRSETYYNVSLNSKYGPFTTDDPEFLGLYDPILIRMTKPMMVGQEVWIEVTEKND